ncbi:low molecular weight phosphatase family protein [Streptomyces sp. NBC_01643]|uniref:arsenate-mycothiol transferase ArsC n=1 Tax=Streptomyces sp. NBC_01643 TaxID=2975906 RepID=UPI00386F1136|nr:low molecular weight phosphatase family protein [Streptomyces sp. NBC_01643]
MTALPLPDFPPLRGPRDQLARAARRLTARYTGTFGTETVESYLEECHTLLSSRATVPTYLPVLAERFATQRLDAIARTIGLKLKSEPEILFVCTENAGRSQLASALLRQRVGRSVRIHSAGTLPAAWIDPVALRLMSEAGLSPGAEFPKPLTHEMVRASDIVVALGCGDACPILPGRRYYDWNVPDLKGLDIESARSVGDALALRVERLAIEVEREAAL